MTCARGAATSVYGVPFADGYTLVPNKSVLVVGPQQEPLSLDEAKLRAGLDWPAGDPRDAQMDLFIKAARSRVERDTGYALLTQTRDVYLSHLVSPVEFPPPARPLQNVEDVLVPTASGYVVLDRTRWTAAPDGAVVFVPGPPPEPPPPLTESVLYPWIFRIVVGWEHPADVPPLLQFAVGLLCAHYATAARDAVVLGTIATEIPLGYEDAIADFRLIAV